MQKYNDGDEVSWGEFLQVVISSEHNVPCCWLLQILTFDDFDGQSHQMSKSARN